MKSVKILIANKTMGSGKSTLGIALANYIYNQIEQINLPPTLFDCSETLHSYNKCLKELEINNIHIPPYEIIPLPIYKDSLLHNTMDIIQNRDALYIFDLPTNTNENSLFRLLFSVDIVICPLILSDKGIFETREFVSFINKSLKIFHKQGFLKKLTIIIIPNMVPKNGVDPHINNLWNEKVSSFLTSSIITPNICWRDNLFNEIPTGEWFTEFQNIFGEPFKIIYDQISLIYKSNYRTQNS